MNDPIYFDYLTKVPDKPAGADHEFKSVSSRLEGEIESRRGLKSKLLTFGLDYLDRAMRGILEDDMILLGAPSGAGKTQFCTNLALSNVCKGKRVHMIALEASEREIERRLKYSLLADAYFKNPPKWDPTTPAPTSRARPLNYLDWRLGDFEEVLEPYEKEVNRKMSNLKNMFTFYKTKTFGVKDLLENVQAVYEDSDLIIVDHVHYFDFEDDNENRALKKIAVEVRKICQIYNTPIILVAHLRKADRKQREIAAGLDEFHGSSDLTKIATKVITLGRGGMTDEPGRFYTYVRIPKCRIDGSVEPYIARVIFESKTNTYDSKFEIGFLKNNGTEFEPIDDPKKIPFWARPT